MTGICSEDSNTFRNFDVDSLSGESVPRRLGANRIFVGDLVGIAQKDGETLAVFDVGLKVPRVLRLPEEMYATLEPLVGGKAKVMRLFDKYYAKAGGVA
jgi:hypothetical protein